MQTIIETIVRQGDRILSLLTDDIEHWHFRTGVTWMSTPSGVSAVGAGYLLGMFAFGAHFEPAKQSVRSFVRSEAFHGRAETVPTEMGTP